MLMTTQFSTRETEKGKRGQLGGDLHLSILLFFRKLFFVPFFFREPEPIGRVLESSKNMEWTRQEVAFLNVHTQLGKKRGEVSPLTLYHH